MSAAHQTHTAVPKTSRTNKQRRERRGERINGVASIVSVVGRRSAAVGGVESSRLEGGRDPLCRRNRLDHAVRTKHEAACTLSWAFFGPFSSVSTCLVLPPRRDLPHAIKAPNKTPNKTSCLELCHPPAAATAPAAAKTALGSQPSAPREAGDRQERDTAAIKRDPRQMRDAAAREGKNSQERRKKPREHNDERDRF